jgi:hypothetical protein
MICCMKRNLIYFFLLLVGIIQACEDVYKPNVEDTPSALVVEGMLTDQNDYVKVKLTHSVPFNDDSNFYTERKATVTIESTGGKSYSTTEVGNGVYQTNEPVPTTVGEEYFVKIITSKNVEYQSKKEKMVPPCGIDSIYLLDSTFRELTYDYWGEPVVTDYKGICFAVLPKEPDTVNAGFLYKWNALVNSYIYSTQGPAGYSYYCWEEMSSNAILVYNYFRDEYINKLPVGDLHSLSYYALGPYPIDSANFQGTISSVMTTGIYYHLRQYAITKDGAKYWQSVKKQSEASGQLFDPVEEQIIGNIFCKSDSTKKAFGYFNVASFTDQVVAVALKQDKVGAMRITDFMPESPTGNDSCFNFAPDFWF